jgi:hypothetical protein
MKMSSISCQRRRAGRQYCGWVWRLLLYIYCIYDSDMRHGGLRSLAGLVGVQCQCYLGYNYLVFCMGLAQWTEEHLTWHTQRAACAQSLQSKIYQLRVHGYGLAGEEIR